MAARVGRRGQQLHATPAWPTASLTASRVRAHNEAGWGPWSEFSAPVTPDTAAGPAGVADGRVRRRRSCTSPGRHRPTRARRSPATSSRSAAGVDRACSARHRHHLHVDRPDQRHQLPVPRRRDATPPDGPSRRRGPAAEHPLREPAAPGAPAVGQGDRYLDLSWAQPNDNGDPVIEYQVEMRSRTRRVRAGRRRHHVSLDEPRPTASPQQFRVRARNRDVDWGAWSGWSIPVKPCGVPDAAGCADCGRRGDSAAAVTWAAPGDAGLRDHQYQVATNGGASAGRGRVRRTRSPVSPTAPRYSFEVRAHNSVGWGAWSAAVERRSPPPARRRARVDHRQPVGVGAVDLTGRPPNANGCPLTDYQIVRQRRRAARHRLGAPHSRTAASADSTAYSFKVRACNDVGCGAWSAGDSATTWGVPDSRHARASTPATRTIDATWSAPAAQRHRRSTATMSTSTQAGRTSQPARRSRGTPQQRHQLPGSGPRLQRRRLRGVERAGRPSRRDRRSTCTISKGGERRTGQPGAATPRCT